MERGNVKKPVYILIAGPQASGKSTAVSVIAENFSDVRAYDETGLQVIIGRGLTGGAFVSEDDEREIMRRNIERIKTIAGASRGTVVHLDETGIFSVAHARGLGYLKLAGEFLPKFEQALAGVDCRILFLDTDPAVSWARREKYYRGRGLKEDGLVKCRAKIDRAYDEFIRLYDMLDYPKIKVENNGGNLGKFKKAVVVQFKKLKVNPAKFNL